MTETPEVLKAKIAELEAKLSAEKTKNSKAKKEISFHVTLDDGLFQIRRLTPKSINLPIEAVIWIIEHAQDVLKFEATNRSLLSYKADTEDVSNMKLGLRETKLNAGDSVVRKPRAENKTEFA